MMTKQIPSFLISAAVASIASSGALASVDIAKQIKVDKSASDALNGALDTAFSQKHSIVAVGSSLNSLSLAFESAVPAFKKLNEQNNELLARAGSSDSTSGIPHGAVTKVANCYSNCYSNCHNACHGSRGWR